MIAVLALAGLSLVLGALLGFAAIRFRVESNPIADKIDQILPQTQCGQCGFAGCRPYAEAIAADEADINRCPPGGAAGVAALAELLGKEAKPLDPENGTERPPSYAVIDEPACIGCTKCIQACPVDAIVGAAKQVHTVLIDECTGCDLCRPPCPVDCIDMIPIPETLQTWKWPKPEPVWEQLERSA
jgi:Na+-translocating ferredoxin:NAD+ oxidoreductase subunit B